MRQFAFSLLFLLGASLYADDAKVRTIILDNKPVYLIQVGHFQTEASAKEKLKQLQAQWPQTTITITKQHGAQDFSIKIGPIQHYEQAKQWKQQLLTLSKPSEPPPTPAASSPSALAPSSLTKAVPAVTDKKLWNLNGADLRVVIAEISRVTGKNFIIDPRVQGKISIVSRTPLSNSALYQVFLSMLQVSGYAAITTNYVTKIIPIMDAKTLAPDASSLPPGRLQGDEVLISVIPVYHVPAEQLVPVLRPLLPQWSYVSAYMPSNMLILSGRAENIKQLSRIIHQVDTSSANDIDVIQLQYAIAMDIASTLKDLIKTTSGSGQTPLSLAVDDRNNAILLSGNKTDRIRLRIIIAKLDHQSSNTASNNTQVVYLHYLRAEDLVPILAGIAQANFSGTVGTTVGTITVPVLDSTNPNANIAPNSGNPYSQQPLAPVPPPPKAPTNPPSPNANQNQNEGSTKPTVQIIAEPNTNSIIINAPASVIRTLKTVIAQLDVRPAQLLIEAMVAEINESDINNLGIEWGTLGQTKDSAKFRPGFAIINSKTSVNDFQAQIYALERERKANVLSTPSVVVLDNRQAKIIVGQQVSVASTNYPNNANGTTTASPYTTFNRINVALHLYVRPQITRGGGIQLQIDEGHDTVDPTSLANSETPVFNISSIVTAVHIESGDVVVLGGLTQDTLANEKIDLPILKNIPGLGRLFQRHLRDREKRVLMVFIRPMIIYNPKEAIRLTGDKYYDPIRNEELGFVKTQDAFVQTDQQTVLPPLKQAKLPVPFSQMLPLSK